MKQKTMTFISSERFNILLSAPALILLLFVVVQWMFYYNDIISLIFFLSIIVLSPLGIITAIWQLIRKNIKQCSFIAVIFAIAWMMQFPREFEVIPWSRHYVEFLIQKNIYIHEMSEINKDTPYKLWEVKENAYSNFKIIYDPSDETAKQDQTYRTRTAANGVSTNIGYYYVYKLGNHFYMREDTLVYD